MIKILIVYEKLQLNRLVLGLLTLTPIIAVPGIHSHITIKVKCVNQFCHLVTTNSIMSIASY